MIRLYRPGPHWEQLLRQEGVPYGIGWPADEGSALLIANGRPDRSDRLSIVRWVESDGLALCGPDAAAVLWPELVCGDVKLRRIIPDDSDFFRNTGVVDVECRGSLLAGAAIGTDSRGRSMLHSSACGRGWRAILPFEVETALADLGSTARQFPAEGPRLPNEKVSRVSRGEVRRLVANCLRVLLGHRSLPYVHLAYTETGRGVFGLRIDTDESSPKEMARTARLADQAGMRFSWYINARTADPNLVRSLAATDQDVQLHCYRHRVFPDRARNRENLKKGIESLGQAGVRPCGTVAPYGDWNPELGAAMAELGFEYSSEFSYAYDDLPSFPVVDGRALPVLQVPVHPICTGGLRAVRMESEAMACYFRNCAALQAARAEPCFIYDHPESVARHEQVMLDVLGCLRRRCGTPTTLTEYACWWQGRLGARFTVRSTERDITIEAEAESVLLPISVQLRGVAATIPLRNGRSALGPLDWRRVPVVTVPAATRRPDLRARARQRVRAVRKHLQERRY